MTTPLPIPHEPPPDPRSVADPDFPADHLGVTPTEAAQRVTQNGTATRRLSALDAWRGLTVLLMLLVNNVSLGAFTPAALQHAPFGSLTLTDLVFPWFLFCAGAALPFSAAAMRRTGLMGARRVQRLVTRAITLYLVGAFVTSVTQHAFTLGLGVLQLIALSTLFAALVVDWPAAWQGVLAGALLTGYAAFLGTGAPVTENVNAVQALNDAVLGPLGLRGLLSVVPTTALVLLGSLAARPMQRREARAAGVLLAFGTLLTAAGALWAAAGLPLSKSLWTPPYILLSAGLGTLGILAFWVLADSGRLPVGARLLAPLTIPGRNALTGYVLPILIKMWVLLDWQVTWAGAREPMGPALLDLARAALGPVGGGWTYTLGYVLTVWLGLAWMARRGLIWKL